MRRWIISATLAVALTIAASALASAWQSHDVEVRVAARRLDDGRTEFGVQLRQPDGSWGDRVLPRNRMFPADPGHDRWLVSSPVTLVVEATPAPAPTTADASRLDVVFSDAGAPAPVLAIRVTPDHVIEQMRLKLLPQIDGQIHQRHNVRAIAAGASMDVSAVRDKRWDDVAGLTARTLDGRLLRTWTCAPRRSWLAEARFACSVSGTRTLPALTNATDPALGVGIVVSEHEYRHGIRVHVRAGVDHGRVAVRLQYGGDFEGWESDFHSREDERHRVNAGDAVRLGGGGYHGWDGIGPTPSHTDVVTVLAASSTLGAMRCERHADSDAEISVWACAPW